ncbi:glutaredoxin [Kwoniella dejecticola CBS 10117]|uniref:Glutaredoxin n=1 Tax=Kwoniella dejecticola CBS 10117 TaxID=1296121 RepID=A0A1A6A6J5_9TREE|nr:glutaredoxin [Kwoniella dejecticola CBS 10117]OBR85675.1 glutaredoxin [Kwoniella dejecticola CBS 10117]
MIRSTSGSSSSSSASASSGSSSSFAALGFTSTSSDFAESSSSAVAEKLALRESANASISRPSSSYSQSPRRAFSLPSKIKLPFTSPRLTSSPVLGLGSPMIPLHSPTRLTARRFSYGLKSRASHYALPLSVAGLFTLGLFIWMSMNSSSEVSRFNSSSRLQLYGRSRFSEEEHAHKIKYSKLNNLPGYDSRNEYEEGDSGIKFLVMDEEELIAEDDLFWDSYKDPEPLSREEQKLADELKAHKADVIKHDKIQSLRALVWWLAEGGILPNDWEVPTKAYLKKIGGRGMERLLEDIDGGDEDDEIFDNGWAEFANKRYRVVIFSKTHCPFSKKAKSIFGEYHISPAPFIIELDQRSDMDKIQTLLQRITGRRTVPNVLLDFASIGGSDDVTLLHSEGGLQRRLEDMDVLPFSRRGRPAPVPVPVAAPELVEEVIQPEPEAQGLAEETAITPADSEDSSTTVDAGNVELKRQISDRESEDEDDDILLTPKLGKRELAALQVERKVTNAERFNAKRREVPGTGNLELTDRSERGSWREDGVLM